MKFTHLYLLLRLILAVQCFHLLHLRQNSIFSLTSADLAIFNVTVTVLANVTGIDTKTNRTKEDYSCRLLTS